MKLTALDGLLWAFAFLGTLSVLMALLCRSRWKRFPVLTSWLLYQTAYSIGLFLLYITGAEHLYIKTYWIGLWPDFLLQICVAVEIARVILCWGDWVRGARGILIVAGMSGIVIAALLCWWISPPRGTYTVWELRSDLFTSLVVCELLVVITLIANWLGLAWPNDVLAIVEGLTAWSAIMSLTTALQAYLGARDFRTVDHFRIYAWIGAMAWITVEFWGPKTRADSPTAQPSEGASRTADKMGPSAQQVLNGGGILAFRRLFSRRPASPRFAPDFATDRSVMR